MSCKTELSKIKSCLKSCLVNYYFTDKTNPIHHESRNSTILFCCHRYRQKSLQIDTQWYERRFSKNLQYKLFSTTDSGTCNKRLLRLPHSSRFFFVELQIFCRDQIGLKLVGTSVCRTLADFLSRLTAFRLGAESISAMFEKTLVHVTLMTIPHWLRYARAPTNYLDLHTSRQGPTRRFEI